MTSKEDLMQQYRQMIEALQTENKNLKQRLDWYEKNNTDITTDARSC